MGTPLRPEGPAAGCETAVPVAKGDRPQHMQCTVDDKICGALLALAGWKRVAVNGVVVSG